MVTEAVYSASQNLLGLEAMQKRLSELDRVKKAELREAASRFQHTLFRDEGQRREAARQMRFKVQGEESIQREFARLEFEARRQRGLLHAAELRQEELMQEFRNIQSGIDRIRYVLDTGQPTLNGLAGENLEGLLRRRENLVRALNAHPPSVVTIPGRQTSLGGF